MARTARELMQTHLITVSPETPLLDVHRLFVEEEINGAPVVSDDGTVLGVISSLDLVRAVQQEHETGAATPIYFRENLEFSSPDWAALPEDFQDRLSELTAADAMTEEVISVPPDASIAEVARIMRSQRIHRVLVVDGQQLVGILSTFDLVGLLENPQGENEA